jgi:hypothetical protein
MVYGLMAFGRLGEGERREGKGVDRVNETTMVMVMVTAIDAY